AVIASLTAAHLPTSPAAAPTPPPARGRAPPPASRVSTPRAPGSSPPAAGSIPRGWRRRATPWPATHREGNRARWPPWDANSQPGRGPNPTLPPPEIQPPGCPSPRRGLRSPRETRALFLPTPATTQTTPLL